MKSKFNLGVALGVLILGFSPAVQAINLVVNGGFEADAFDLTGMGDWRGSMAGWNGTGASATVEYFAGTPGPYAPGFGPHSGVLAAAFSTVEGTDSISQDLATVAGQDYEISFWLSNQLDPANPNSMSASFGSTVLMGGSTPIPGELPSGMPWTRYSFHAVATSALTTLTFDGGNVLAANLLDDVSVSSSRTVPDSGNTGGLLALVVGACLLASATPWRKVAVRRAIVAD